MSCELNTNYWNRVSLFSLALSLSGFNSTILLDDAKIKSTRFSPPYSLEVFTDKSVPSSSIRKKCNVKKKEIERERERESTASINGKRPGTDKWSGNY